MAGQTAKRKYVRNDGLVAVAKKLGCTMSHLRRVVIGERESRSLMARYAALIATESPSKSKPKSKTP